VKVVVNIIIKVSHVVKVKENVEIINEILKKDLKIFMGKDLI
jgi:hypothetical protein